MYKCIEYGDFFIEESGNRRGLHLSVRRQGQVCIRGSILIGAFGTVGPSGQADLSNQPPRGLSQRVLAQLQDSVAPQALFTQVIIEYSTYIQMIL